jgi:hypothetical protein
MSELAQLSWQVIFLCSRLVHNTAKTSVTEEGRAACGLDVTPIDREPRFIRNAREGGSVPHVELLANSVELKRLLESCEVRWRGSA